MAGAGRTDLLYGSRGVPPSGCGTPVRSSRPGAFAHGASAWRVACVGSGSGSRLGAGLLPDGVSVGRTAGPAGGSWRCWGASLACTGAGGWYPAADGLGVAGAWGRGLPVGMWAWGRMVPRSHSGRALVASVLVMVHVRVEGLSDGACVGPFVGWTGGLWCRWGPGLACVGAAGWWPRVDASGGVWGCGPGSPAGPGSGLVCGLTVARGCSGRAPAVLVFVWLGMVPLPAGDARLSRIAVAAWCCGWFHCAARLDAPPCRGLCGVPAPDGAGTPVVRVA